MACGVEGGGGVLDGVWAAPAPAVVGAGRRVGGVVGGPARVGSARGWWQRGQAGGGGGQFGRPRPVAWQAQRRAAGVEGQASGGVQQPVAQRLGFADGELAVERQVLGPGGEVLGDQRQLEPDGVVIEVAEGEVLKPGLLGGADAVLGAGAGACRRSSSTGSPSRS